MIRLDDGVLHEDRGRAESFGLEARRYDRSRPGYPHALIDDLMSGGKGDARARGAGAAGGVVDVVDVGCGTGIAARLLAARGANVVGVEPDKRMAAVARSSGIHVEVSRFEDWLPRGRMFDLVSSAQAWHWVDPVRGTECAAAVLRPGGRLAVFWNVGRGEPHVQAVLEEVYRRLRGPMDGYALLMGATDDRRLLTAGHTIDACGAFLPAKDVVYAWEKRYTRDEWLDQLHTHSDHAALAPDRLSALLDAVGDAIDGLGGSITVRYSTVLISAVRR